jgi:hypothetical protein
LHSDEYYSIITELDPVFAQQIIRLFINQDMAEGIMTMKEIGDSVDPKITDIIDILIFNFGIQDKPKTELLLRVLLESVFSSSKSEMEFLKLLSLNRPGIELLMKRIDTIDSPLLRSKIISLIPYYQNPDYFSVIIKEGYRLTGLLKKGVMQNTEMNQEIIQIIESLDAIDSKDASGLYLDIMENTREKVIFDKAKTSLKKSLNR